MSRPFNVNDIAEKLGEMIREVVGNNPKIYPYNCLESESLEKWQGKFAYSGGIHGWVIKRSARMGELRDNGDCYNYIWTYNIWGFYKFSDSVTVKSDTEFGIIIDDIADKINSEPVIILNDSSFAHYGLEFPKITTLKQGERRLHFAAGEITIYFET